MRRLILALLIAGLLSAGALAAWDQAPARQPSSANTLQVKIAKSNAELAGLQTEIQAFQNQELELDNQEEAIRRHHDEVINEIDLTRQLLGEMDLRERLLAQQSQVLSDELLKSKRHYEASRQALSSHLRSMYIRGHGGKLESLMTSGSFSSLVTRMKWNELMVTMGAGLVDDTRNEARLISSRQKQLEVSLAEIWLSREEMGEQSAHMEDLLAEQVAALRDLATERRDIKDHLLELSMNKQRLAYVLTDLEDLRIRRLAEESSRANQLTELAGELEWPTRGELLRGFGRSVHPRFQTVTLNNGINIAAQLGAPVASVATGKVEFSDRLPGFGQCVIIDHGSGYYSLYAHLESVFVTAGEEIARGQVIAEVGRPEPGEPSQLYFEIRSGKTPLNPLDWLRAR